MKITNYELIQILNTLNKYADRKLPQKISYAITKNILHLNEDNQCYTGMLEKSLNKFKEHFVKDDSGNVVMGKLGIPEVDQEVLDDYMTELNNLLAMEIDVDLYTIDESVFDYDDDKCDLLSANDMIALSEVLCKKVSEVA